jgi:hypothetical protein
MDFFLKSGCCFENPGLFVRELENPCLTRISKNRPQIGKVDGIVGFLPGGKALVVQAEISCFCIMS